ncbi:MAG: DivIVA domain-containing protein [Acidimicrobiales bacterium]
MSSEDPAMVSISSQTGLQPDEISRRTFPAVRKGVDGEAVRRYLDVVADSVREALDREQALRKRLAEAERRAAEPELDEQTLLRAVGAETARILQTAHDAAADVIAKAEARAAEILAAAEAVLGERTAVADAEASALLAAARSEAETLTEESAAAAVAAREGATNEAELVTETARAEAVALLDATRSECRRVVREARDLRASVLGDLAERRRSLRVQLEQLRTGRDSLLEVVDAVGDAVDQLRERLANAEHEARLAAAEAGERVEAEADAEADESAELEGALAIEVDLEGAEIMQVVEALEAVIEEAVVEAVAEAVLEAVIEEAVGDAADVAVLNEDALDEVLGGDIGGTALYDDEAVSDEEAQPTSHRSVDELFARIRASRTSESPAGEPGPDDGHEPEEMANDGVLGNLSAHEAAVAEADEDVAGIVEAAAEEAAAASDESALPLEGSPDALALAQRAELLGPVTTKLGRALKRALQDDQNVLLDALRHSSGAPDLAALLPEDQQLERISGATAALLSEAWTIGHDWLGGGKPAAEDATRAGARLATELATEVTALLRHRLVEALSPLGEGADGSADAAGAAYREWRGSRVEGSAGDFATRAFCDGAVTGGAGVPVRWVVDDEGQPCPDCDDNALAGAVDAGEEFPTGQLHPPVHPGCRCLLVAITS